MKAPDVAARIRKVAAYGETKTIAEWARDPRCRITDSAIRYRIRCGLTPEAAIGLGQQNHLPGRDPNIRSPATEQAKRKAQETRIRNRANKIRGDHAEAVVAHHLHRMGFLCVVRLETGWRVRRKGKAIIGAQPMAKVTGDFRAVMPGGRSVLVEVKRRPDVLRYSDFQPHSRAALTAHEAAGGLSLVAWVSRHGVAILAWNAMTPQVRVPWPVAEVCTHLVPGLIEEAAKLWRPMPETGSKPAQGLESPLYGPGSAPFPFQ